MLLVHAPTADDKARFRLPRAIECASGDVVLFENVNVGSRYAHILNQVNRAGQ